MDQAKISLVIVHQSSVGVPYVTAVQGRVGGDYGTLPASDFASLFRTELRRPRHTSGKKAQYGRRNFRIVDRSIDCNRSSCSAILGPIDPPPDVVRHVSGASPAYRDRYRGRRGGHY